MSSVAARLLVSFTVRMLEANMITGCVVLFEVFARTEVERPSQNHATVSELIVLFSDELRSSFISAFLLSMSDFLSFNLSSTPVSIMGASRSVMMCMLRRSDPQSGVRDFTLYCVDFLWKSNIFGVKSRLFSIMNVGEAGSCGRMSCCRNSRVDVFYLR